MSEQSPAEKARKRMTEKPLFFDLETMRHPNVEHWVEKHEPNLDDIHAPRNYTDIAKIEAYVAKATAEAQDKSDAEYEGRLAKAPLDPDLGAIRAIGIRKGVDGEIYAMIVPQEKDFKPPETFGGGRLPSDRRKRREVHPMKVEMIGTERAMIDTFWQLYRHANGETVGYNSIAFDLPYLQRRSMDLQIQPLNRVDLRRYQIKPSTDLMGILYNWGRAKSMKFVCQRYGIENPNPEWDGSMVAEMTDTEVCQYVAGDIYMLTELWKKMSKVYWAGTR